MFDYSRYEHIEEQFDMLIGSRTGERDIFRPGRSKRSHLQTYSLSNESKKQMKKPWNHTRK